MFLDLGVEVGFQLCRVCGPGVVATFGCRG